MGSGYVVEIKITVSTTFLQPFLTGPVAYLKENDPDFKIEMKSNNVFEHSPFE